MSASRTASDHISAEPSVEQLKAPTRVAVSAGALASLKDYMLHGAIVSRAAAVLVQSHDAGITGCFVAGEPVGNGSRRFDRDLAHKFRPESRSRECLHFSRRDGGGVQRVREARRLSRPDIERRGFRHLPRITHNIACAQQLAGFETSSIPA